MMEELLFFNWSIIGASLIISGLVPRMIALFMNSVHSKLIRINMIIDRQIILVNNLNRSERKYELRFIIKFF